LPQQKIKLIAIAVADAIHILSAYYQLRAQQPEAPVRELVVKAMVEMMRPVTLTTLTKRGSVRRWY
jgi:predicted RND superfamily exporter protein